MLEKIIDERAQPFIGGAITSIEKALLPFGAFSDVKNLRNTHPGLIQRPGMRKLHTTADGSNQVLSLYQWIKERTTEQHFFAQMSDGDVLEATSDPPTVTTGAFGSEVHDGTSGQLPASWGNLDDILIYSNGADDHQIYGGSTSYVSGCVVFKGSALPATPAEGYDYSDEITNVNTAKYADLGSLDTYANGNALYIRTPVPAKSFTFALSQLNVNASVGTLYYHNTSSVWGAITVQSDGTATGGASLGQNGTITFTAPTDIQETFAFGRCGYWYRLGFSAALDATVKITSITYDSDFQAIANLWSGVADYAVECRVEGTSQWYVYSAGAVDLDALTSGKKIRIAATDPLEGIYIDPGATPNDTGTSIATLKYHDGSDFQVIALGGVEDGTSGMSQAGWIRFPRQAAKPVQLDAGLYYAYWYEITWDSAIAADTVVSIQTMPYFSIDDYGNAGIANVIWKDRALYTFDRYSSYIYVSQRHSHMVLNGSDYGILQAGDGRANKIVSMRRFHNELMVWQIEKGVEGGCVTLFEGYSPSTFGKLLLSSRLGAMNNKSVVVVDGIKVATATDETIKTLAFWISREGLCMSDGRTCTIISDDIKNYFESDKDECIRAGYENEHWLEYDAAYGVLRIGLVSGTTATKPNVFPVYDLVTKTFSFDTPYQELSCFTNVEAASGGKAVLQVAGGIDDGQVYQCNYGSADVTEPIVSGCDMEFSIQGAVLQLDEFLLRTKAQDAGFVLLIVFDNGIEVGSVPLDLTALAAGQAFRRHLQSINVTSEHVSLRLECSSLETELNLLERGLSCYKWDKV